MVNVFKVNAQFLASKHNEYTFKDETFSGETYSFLVTENLNKPVVVSKFINSQTDKQEILKMSNFLKSLKPMQNVVLLISHNLQKGSLKENIEQVF